MSIADAKFCSASGVPRGPHLALEGKDLCKAHEEEKTKDPFTVDKEVPSTSATAAEKMLEVPMMMRALADQMNQILVGINEANKKMIELISKVAPELVSTVPPRNYFLNEAHELPRITKAQARRERAAAKKSRAAPSASASRSSTSRRSKPSRGRRS